ncbi:DNA repair protein RecN [Candidatus Poribacteria bacterium]|nr:DNA repair protein RecN [Candidatus Poribacteria bacterium]
MLETLHIRNFALIDDLVIPWKTGLNVLTGETGAGKSIIVDAMSLLLGERAAGVFIRKGAEMADIQALFDISNCIHVKDLLDSMELDGTHDELVLRRIISIEGKSRCFLNGTVATLSLLSKVGSLLVDMHGQHEHQSLMSPERHLSLLDDFAGLGADAAVVRQRYQELKHLVSSLERFLAREASLGQRVAELQQELELLDRAELKEGEDEEIKSRRDVIANSEKLFRLATDAYDTLYGGETHSQPLVNMWENIMQALKEIADIDLPFRQSLAQYEELKFRFSELAEMLRVYSSKLEYDPAELETLERRLETISRLKRRHGCNSLRELIELKRTMHEEYNQLADSSGERTRLEQEMEHLREETGKVAFVLSQKRSEAAALLEKKIEMHLRDLGMGKARFLVSVRQEHDAEGLVQYKEKRWRLWSTGVDRVEFFLSANVGEPPRPLRAIASGGEISRIMLAIRTILAETDKVPVIIFDEIDAGVGASMGMPIGEKLLSVAGSHQVICVTHLPQIAAMADNHIVVDKIVSGGRTRTEITFPAGRERVQEIARMLGGGATGQISLKHAQELLALSRRNR